MERGKGRGTFCLSYNNGIGGVLMLLNIAVCDDSEDYSAELSEQIFEICEEKGISAQVYMFRSGEELLASDTAPNLNIIFMDIYLDGISGLKTAQNLPVSDNCRVVFITFSTDHAVEAFDLNAAHYLVKPTTKASVAEALERCVKQISCACESVLEIKSGNVTVPIPTDKIVYIEVMNKFCAIHTVDNTFKVWVPLGTLYDQLDKGIFMRVQQSYVVNMSAIEKFSYDRVVIRGGKNIVLSRKNRAELKEQYQSYLFRLARGSRT